MQTRQDANVSQTLTASYRKALKHGCLILISTQLQIWQIEAEWDVADQERRMLIRAESQEVEHIPAQHAEPWAAAKKTSV